MKKCVTKSIKDEGIQKVKVRRESGVVKVRKWGKNIRFSEAVALEGCVGKGDVQIMKRHVMSHFSLLFCPYLLKLTYWEIKLSKVVIVTQVTVTH